MAKDYSDDTKKYGKTFENDPEFNDILSNTSIEDKVKITQVHKNINSLAGQLEKSQQGFQKEMKSITSFISSTTKSQQKLSERINMKELSSSKEIKSIEKSAQQILGKLGYTIDVIGRGSKRILTNTAIATKETMSQYGQALKEDFNINKGNLLAASLAKASPLFGYFAGKFMETDIFQKASNAIKEKFTESITFVGNKIKDLWGTSIDKFKNVYSRLPEIMERMSIVIKNLPNQLLKFMDFLNTLPKKFYNVLDKGIKFIGSLPEKLFKTLDTIFDKTPKKLVLFPYAILFIPI